MARKHKVVAVGVLEEIRRLNAEGLSDRQISIEIGMYEENVRKHRNAMGLPTSLEVRKQLAAKQQQERAEKERLRADASRAKRKAESEMRKVDEHCIGCNFLTEIHANGTLLTACYYLGFTGKKRPCPPGKDCTVKDTSKRKPKPVDDIW